jgi:hypothetical protein
MPNGKMKTVLKMSIRKLKSKTANNSSQTKLYIFHPMMLRMAAWAHLANIQQHAEELQKQFQTNSFCNGPCTEETEYSNIHLNKQYENQFHHRSKQAFPLIPLAIGMGTSIAAANVISSAVSGDAPLSWFGKSIAPILGLSTSNGDPDIKQILLATAKEISKLQLSDVKIMETIQNVAKETVAFEKRYMVNMEAIALLTMAQDLSNTIKHISQIIQLTVGKYAQILTHAAMGTTSPYALPFAEVEGLSRALYIQKGLHLQTDLTQIRSRAIIHENILVLIFEIPVLSEAKQYNFYNPTPIPIFSQSEVHIPKFDAQYIAISKLSTKYYAMTAEEFR